MNDQVVICDISDSVATVTLNEPTKLNPMSTQLQVRLREVLVQLRDDKSVRAMILTGAGKGFCAGTDLRSTDSGEQQSRGQAAADIIGRLLHPIILELRELPFPVVSAINGPAAGAGVGLALAADIILAARSAYFYLPFLPKMGIVPDAGCTWFLPRLIGPGRALSLALLGERLSAERAAQWGLIWECVDDAELLGRARLLAKQLAAMPAHAALEARRAFAAAERHTLSEQLHYECDRQRELIDGPAFSEGARAFLEKRQPVFGER